MGFLDRFKSNREQELKDKSLVKGAIKEINQNEIEVAKDIKKIESDKINKVAEKKPVAKKEVKQKVKSVPEALGYIILYPLVTEKAAVLAAQGIYVFVLSTRANRIQVRDAVKAMYGITPVNVNIQNIRGKKVRFGRHRGQRNSWKKAFVTLPKGETIDVYEDA